MAFTPLPFVGLLVYPPVKKKLGDSPLSFEDSLVLDLEHI